MASWAGRQNLLIAIACDFHIAEEFTRISTKVYLSPDKIEVHITQGTY